MTEPANELFDEDYVQRLCITTYRFKAASAKALHKGEDGVTVASTGFGITLIIALPFLIRNSSSASYIKCSFIKCTANS